MMARYSGRFREIAHLLPKSADDAGQVLLEHIPLAAWVELLERILKELRNLPWDLLRVVRRAAVATMGATMGATATAAAAVDSLRRPC